MSKCEFLKRSSKGEDINTKIEGLKKYIKDYSLLNEKNKDEVIQDLLEWINDKIKVNKYINC